MFGDSTYKVQHRLVVQLIVRKTQLMQRETRPANKVANVLCASCSYVVRKEIEARDL